MAPGSGAESGATRTLDLTVAPPTRNAGKLVWITLFAVTIGGAWAVFFREGGAPATSGAGPRPGARLERFDIAGRTLAVRVAEDWKRIPTPRGAAFELPVPGDGTVTLTFTTARPGSARANMERFLANEAVGLEIGLEVLFDRFRWLDTTDGLGAFEIVIGESDVRPTAGSGAGQHFLWIDVDGGSVHATFTIPPNAPDFTVDRVEQVIATLKAA